MAPCDYMDMGEKAAAALVNQDAMRKYAWDLAQKAAPKNKDGRWQL